MTARTPVAVATLNRATGIAPTAYANSDAVNGNVVANDGRTWLELSNTDAATQTIQVHPARTVDGQAAAAVSHSMVTTALLKLGPFPVADYSGQLAINCSVAGLKVAAYRIPE